MTIRDLQALWGGQRRPGRAWSPRECVWLMLLAQQRPTGSDQTMDLVQRLRSRIRREECRPEPLTPEWDWRLPRPR